MMRMRAVKLYRGLACLSAVVLLSTSAGMVAAQTMHSSGRTTGANNPALRYFGGGGAGAAYRAPQSRAVAASMPQVNPPQGAPQQSNLPSQTKPFAQYSPGSTISPFLALDFRESEYSIPNYYAYVRPQLEQQRHLAEQDAQMQRLQQQVRTATAMPIGPVPSQRGSLPTTGHSNRFLNSGGYFPRR